MKWPALILAGFAASASAGPDTDYPHRDWGQVAALDMTVSEAAACIVRIKSGGGATAQVVPADGGTDIDFRPSAGLFGGSVFEPWETFKLREASGTTSMRIFYRHPYRQDGISKDFARLRKKCLKVVAVRPSA